MIEKVNECIKKYKTKIDIKILLIVILLVVICVMQFDQNKKIEKLSKEIAISNITNAERFERRLKKDNKEFRKEFIGEIRKEFFNTLNEEIREMGLLRERIAEETNRYFDNNNLETKIPNNIAPSNNKNSISFELKSEEKYDEKQKIYTLNIILPKDLNEQDVDISINNSILYVKALKNKTTNNKNKQIKDDFSLLKVVRLPNTKATTGDIKKTFDNRKLTIVIPII